MNYSIEDYLSVIFSDGVGLECVYFRLVWRKTRILNYDYVIGAGHVCMYISDEKINQILIYSS